MYSSRFSVLNSIIKFLKIQDTHRMLGRWSSSTDKHRWEFYADFANSDNCCCSYRLNDTITNKNKNKNNNNNKK